LVPVVPVVLEAVVALRDRLVREVKQQQSEHLLRLVAVVD
jgi:hypothetical protein